MSSAKYNANKHFLSRMASSNKDQLAYLGTTTVFETKDVPIPEYVQNAGHDSNVIEEIQLDLAAAQSKFGKDDVNAKNVDFSDNVMKTHTSGYGIGQVQYELLSCGTNETPLQRYQRLKLEISEFSADLEKLKAENVDTANNVKLAEEVRKLSNNLSEMKVEQMVGNLKLKEPGHSVLTKQLESQIATFKEKSAKEGTSAGSLTYEVHYRGDHAKFAEAAKLAALEKRIADLEKNMGKDLKLLSTISADSAEKNLMGAINNIQTKLSLIEPSDYTHIDTRLQAVLHKMDLLKSKAKDIPETNNKITEVYDSVRKIEPVISILPNIVDRLSALKVLHEQAAQFASNLTTLETTQANVTKNLANQSALLKKVEDNISENLKQITENCANVNARIDKIAAKGAQKKAKK
ncbi:hypothetical protein ACHWQZ_G019409 [Mnemiopsis leidyi]